MALLDDVHAVAIKLRAQARRYRTFASTVHDAKVVELCLAMARSLEGRADHLELDMLERLPADRRHAA